MGHILAAVGIFVIVPVLTVADNVAVVCGEGVLGCEDENIVSDTVVQLLMVLIDVALSPPTENKSNQSS